MEFTVHLGMWLIMLLINETVLAADSTLFIETIDKLIQQ